MRHDDASTVEALLRAADEPGRHDRALCSSARRRLSLGPDSLLDVPFLVERCGDTLSYVGQRFENGSALFEETGIAATYSMRVEDEERWLEVDQVKRLIEVRHIEPLGIVVADVDFATVEPWPPKKDDQDTRKYRLVENWADDESDEAASFVLALCDNLVEKCSKEGDDEGSQDKASGGDGRGLFSRRGACDVSASASKLTKALCRGRALSASPETISLPFESLVTTRRRSVITGETGLCAAIRVLLCGSLCSSSPWRAPSSGLASVGECAALWLAAAADRRLRLRRATLNRLKATALALWARDEPMALWPWRGWRSKEKLCSLKLDFADADSDALRVVLRLRPRGLSRPEAVALTRILATLTDSNPPTLVALTGVRPTALNRPKLAAETELSAYDMSLRPSSFLVLMQAALPFPPTTTDQHSLRALAELVHRLSSGLNSRAARRFNSTADTSRFTSFLDTHHDDDHDNDQQQQPYPEWHTTSDAVRLTAAEKSLLTLVKDLQAELRDTFREENDNFEDEAREDAFSRVSTTTHLCGGRQPTPLESRTAFLILFGFRVDLHVNGNRYYAMLIGDSEHPVVVQPASNDEEGGALKYLDRGSAEQAAVSKALVQYFEGGRPVTSVCAPLGFRWRQVPQTVAWDGVSFLVDGLNVRPFNASALLEPCATPPETKLPADLRGLLERAFYYFEEDNGLQTLRDLDRRRRDDGVVYEWFQLAEKSRVPRAAWRDAFVKLICRERGKVEISPCSRDGSRGGRGAIQQLTEGVVLRIFYACAAIYPTALSRCSELCFAVDETGAPFAHLFKTLSVLAFGSYDDRSDFAEDESPQECAKKTKRKRVFSMPLMTPHHRRSDRRSQHFLPDLAMEDDDDELDSRPSKRPSLNLGALPDCGHGTLYGAPWRRSRAAEAEVADVRVTTDLWKHQLEARDRVVLGIKAGKRGFADASAVGSGKTLTALAVCVEVSKMLSKRTGCLVLCPTNSLVAEWCQQARLHTAGVEIVVQRANGALSSKGISTGLEVSVASSRRKSHKAVVELGPRSLVITTLARHREHPFVNQPGWDFVVVDECLSVQSESARQAAEAWRSVAASRGGVLLLSATLFRSSFSALFYMCSMMRSPLPRTADFLPALLKEHCVCFVPESKRSWKLRFAKAPLSAKAAEAYRSRLDAFASARVGRGGGTPRELYVALKALLRHHYEPATLITHVKAQVEKLRSAKRKVLVFANTEREADRFVEAIDEAERYTDDCVSPVIVLTVAEGSQGLNLQHKADSVVCRPQPGDVLEQMKGRVDRPGQSRSKLDLVVVAASETVEEAEMANIRLCGHFFRQYLDPLAVTFQERAVEAQLQAMASKSTTVAKAFSRVVDQVFLEQDDEEDEIEGLVAEAESDSKAVAQTPPKQTASPSKMAAAKAPRAKAPRPQKPIKIFSSESKPATKLTAASMNKALAHLASVDERLAALIAQVGPPTSMLEMIPASTAGRDVCWRSLIKSIVYQQLSTRVAQAMHARLVEACQGTFTPRALLDVEPNMLLSPKVQGGKVGLSRTKADYVRGISALFAHGILSDDILAALDDDAVMKTLTQVRGIGEWSVHMFWCVYFLVVGAALTCFAQYVLPRPTRHLTSRRPCCPGASYSFSCRWLHL